jgi:hypothetical protein
LLEQQGDLFGIGGHLVPRRGPESSLVILRLKLMNAKTSRAMPPLPRRSLNCGWETNGNQPG